MRSHQEIDARSLALAQAIVAKIDSDPRRTGLLRARANCDRWLARERRPAIAEWRAILHREWDEVRQVLLDPSEEGTRLRQSNPFTGVLTSHERDVIFHRFAK
jgi:hypothetical protein